MNPLVDSGGTEIRVGDIVSQSSAVSGVRWADPRLGALWSNAGRAGAVIGLGRKRVRVDFGRNRRAVFGQSDTGQPVIDNVDATMLTVVSMTSSRELCS